MKLNLRGAMAAMTAAGCLAGAAPASAAVMLATFTGTVAQGGDYTDFFGLGGVLDNANFTAIFKYDTSLGIATTGPMVDVRSGGPTWGGVSPILSASLVINGVTDVFNTSGNGSANVTVNAEGWEQTFLYTDTSFSSGAFTDYGFLQLFVLSVPTPLFLTTPYVGGNKVFAAGPVETNMVTHYRTDGGLDVINYAGSFVTQQVVLSPFAVPEPGTWALMIVGFGGVGLMLRRRTSVAA